MSDATIKAQQPVPTFINVGPGRCGTSWLHEALEAHPEIGMSRVKETEYFNTNYEKGKDWYLSHFDDVDGKLAIGEISNNYYLDPSIPAKMIEHNPSIKVIFNVRKPIGLLKSYYQFGVRRGLPLNGKAEDFSTPVGKVMGSGYAHRMKRNDLRPSDTPSLVESVQLSTYLQPYLDQIPAENLYVFDFEKLRTDSQGELERIYTFLGVDPTFRFEGEKEKVNSAIKPKSPLVARLVSKLAFFLRRIGGHAILSRLHKSRTIKALLFKPADQTNTPEFSPPQEVNTLLEKERELLIRQLPQLAQTWTKTG